MIDLGIPLSYIMNVQCSIMYDGSLYRQQKLYKTSVGLGHACILKKLFIKVTVTLLPNMLSLRQICISGEIIIRNPYFALIISSSTSGSGLITIKPRFIFAGSRAQLEMPIKPTRSISSESCSGL